MMTVDNHMEHRTAPGNNCLHHLIEAQAQQRPDAVALLFQNQPLTYQQFNERANQIAHHLKQLGVGAEQLVGVYMNRSPEMIISLLAIHKAGGAYVPFDPAYPDERLKYMLEDSGARIVLTQSELLDTLPDDTGVQMIAVDAHDFSAHPADNLPGGDPGQLAYVIYTSGSTGKPKGVQVEHRSVVHYISSVIECFGTRQDDRILFFSSLNFDASVEEIYTALLRGAALVIRTDDMVTSIPVFLRCLEEWGVTGMALPTAFWHALVNEMEGLPSCLRYVVIGGEKAYPARLARWQQLTDVALWNTYGPTETTIAVTAGEVSTADASKEVPLGRPIKGVNMHLLDEKLEPVPDGETGELYFGGIQVARGYLNRPELTAERFIVNPRNPDERLYKTGDLARIRSDGELEFLGRADGQVKLRGFRVELGEIESVLHNIVDGAVVLAKEDDSGDLRLVAYVVSDKAPATIQDYLKDRLPAYMLPSAYVQLEEIPIAAGGKVDKRALPAPDWSQRLTTGDLVAPRNEIEEKLVKYWSDALGMPTIGITDNFFDLGGHSLLAIRIFARIEKELGKSLPLATLFRAPTIAQFAELLVNGTPIDMDNHHPAVVPIQPEGSMTPFFCVGGGVINLNNVARHLSKDQPFYALQWQGLTDEQMMHGSLVDIASVFIEAIKSVQPSGPYYLGGSFTAGMVAVEMARQLEAAGETVALLVGFDTVVDETSSPTVDPNLASTNPRKKRSFLAKVLGVIARGPSEIWYHVTNPFYYEKMQLKLCHYGVKFYRAINKPLPTWLRTGMAEEYFILQVTKRYEPSEKYAGDFEIFLTPRYYEKYSKLEKFGWSEWIDGAVRVQPTPGEPCTIMLAPNVEHLSMQFKARLEGQPAAASAEVSA
jgi:amino acid adenylation domain-containing protein